VRDLASAFRWLHAGIAYCRDHDLDSWRLYLTGWRARAHLDRAEWGPAERDALEVLAHPSTAVASRITPLTVLGRLRARRGEPGVWPVLDEARDLAQRADELQRLVPTAAARAEAWLLEGRPEAVETETEAVLARTEREGIAASLGELLVLRRRAGIGTDRPRPGVHVAWALELEGRSQDAASTWDRLGLPYERAWAKIAGQDEALAREGLGELREMGAAGAADAAVRLLRERGLRGLARGPRAATARTPYGLTARQFEVLGLLAAGMRNSEIAARLVISERTVDHHVSAVLQKLGVSTRAQAVLEAARWTPLPGQGGG
jgi:DNA-binding CsgD family transcriptional regulator